MSIRLRSVAPIAVVVALLWCGACTSILGDFSANKEPAGADAGAGDATSLEDASGQGHREAGAQDAKLDDVTSDGTEDDACTASVCVTALGANGRHTCATLSDQTLRCWGSNEYGESGPNSDGGPKPVPVTGLGPVLYARAGDTATCALLVDGSVWCWGDNSRGTLGAPDAGALAPDGAGLPFPTPVQVVGPGTAASLGIGAYHACITTTASPAALMCWGFNNFGQAGVPDGSTVTSPTVVPAMDVVRVVLGAFETCVRTSSAEGECFGYNFYGQLGLGDGDGGADSGTDNHRHPIPSAVDLGSLGPISTFAHSTGNQMGVVLPSGEIATWGEDNEGQLGLLDDSGASRPTPTVVPSFDDVTMLSFTQFGSCALRSDGTVWCWGSTAYGQTGNSANGGSVQYAPEKVKGLSNVTQIATGLDHACALIDGGTVECWGWNAAGQLGRATSAVFDPTPAPVEF